MHALLVWWDVHLDRETTCSSGPPGVGLSSRVPSWRPLLISMPHAVTLPAGSTAVVCVAIGEQGMQVERVSGGECVPVARPPWAVEDAGDVHVQRGRYCDLLVWIQLYFQSCINRNRANDPQDGELVMRSRGGSPRESSVQHVLQQMLPQCGALRLHRAVVAQELQRLTVLEAMAAQQGGDFDQQGDMDDVY